MNTESTTTFTFEAKMTAEKADKKKAIQPFAFGMYYWVAVALAVAGILDSIYLAISHYRIYTDIGYESFCAISRAINCDTVSQSPYAIFVGLPVPVWGVLGYVFVLMILILAGTKAAQRKRIWALLFAVSLFYSVYSVVLAIISLVYIHSYCIMCILSYGINFMLLYYCWLIRRRFDLDPYFVSLRNDLVFLRHKRRLTASMLVPLVIGLDFSVDLFSGLLETPTTGFFRRNVDRFHTGRISLDRFGKCGPCDYRVYRLPLFSMQQNAPLSAQADKSLSRKD